MNTLYSLIKLVLIIGLIAGLINPALVLQNSKNPTRLKVIGIFLGAFIVITMFLGLFVSEDDRTAGKISAAKEFMQKEDYQSVIDELKNIDEESIHYAEAKALSQKADSINSITPEERAAAIAFEEKIKLKNSLDIYVREIDDFDFSKLRGSVHLLEGELAQFAIWGDLVKKGEASDDSEIKKLAGQLRTKLTRVQVREFPIMRKEYASIAAKKMWVEDIEVTSSGTGNRQITFIGGVFAANKNKKKFQEDINSIMLEFRFNRVNYKWHKGEQEYSYYTVYEGKDSEIFTFEK